MTSLTSPRGLPSTGLKWSARVFQVSAAQMLELDVIDDRFNASVGGLKFHKFASRQQIILNSTDLRITMTIRFYL